MKYLSEYSEAHDVEGAKNLLNFGEDYTNFLGSQSDWSNQSTSVGASPIFPRKHQREGRAHDSDNEKDSIKQTLMKYLQQYEYINNLCQQQLKSESSIQQVNDALVS